ncbi:MAG: hypothetical protein WCV70_01705 [Patescibacteria group bacterium]
MSDTTILFLAGFAGLATLAGVFLGSLFKKTEKNIIFSASFAAGLMILISIFELIPAAAKNISAGKLFFWVALGIFVIWLANWAIPHLHSVQEIKKCKDKCLARMSYLIAIGLILHDFPEGFAIPSSFSGSPSLGFLVVIATFVHNIPEGYILTMSQPKSGGRGFCYRAAALSMLATFLGSVLAINLLAVFKNLNPIFFVFSGRRHAFYRSS